MDQHVVFLLLGLANGAVFASLALALVVTYRSSGVMTFLVSHHGKVYEKDLGPGTARIAESMTAFNPDGSWQQVDEPEASATR